MDNNEIINQLREENERLKSQLAAVQDSVVHGKCANSEPCDTFCEAIATRKMFKQLQVERDALALENRKLKMFGAEVDAIMRSQDNVWSRQISALCEKVDFAINQDTKALLAAHDAEVAAKAVLDFAANLLVNQKVDVIDCAKVEADQLRAKAGA